MQEVLLIRDDLEDYLPEGRTVDSYIAQSLLECKRILEDDRDVPWARVFDSTNDAYLDNSDSTGRNSDRIQNAISHMTAGMIFRDYSIKQDLEESWSMLADYHEQMAKDRLTTSRLDIDWDDSGAVDLNEEGSTGQSFLVK
jgi:hypothetical protein